jgi:hypothetical protein
MTDILSPSPWSDRQDSLRQNPPISYAGLQAEVAKLDGELRDVCSDCAELEILADARCAEKQIVEEDRDAYRAMCAELVEELAEAWPYVPEHHGSINHKINTVFTKARKLLEGE